MPPQHECWMKEKLDHKYTKNVPIGTKGETVKITVYVYKCKVCGRKREA